MNDRLPTYPGRVQLAPVSGQTNIYDMTMADEPTIAGTPPIKANLLTDATAAIIEALKSGNTTPATVNEALALLAGSMGRVETGSYVGTGTYGQANPTSITFSDITPKLVLIYADGGLQWSSGTVSLQNGLIWGEGMTTVYMYNNTVTASLSGKTLSWYAANAQYDYQQLNGSGTTYYYLGIG